MKILFTTIYFFLLTIFVDRKATIKFMNKDGAEKQEIVSYLDLSKLTKN